MIMIINRALCMLPIQSSPKNTILWTPSVGGGDLLGFLLPIFVITFVYFYLTPYFWNGFLCISLLCDSTYSCGTKKSIVFIFCLGVDFPFC